jgi:glycosyltransferase involved in cell wall biosynthesis
MVITYLLPGMSKNKPAGGFRVVYEYANRLSRRGHRVNVVHPLIHSPDRLSLKRRLGIPPVLAINRLTGLPRVGWLDIDPKVNILLVRSLEEKYIPKADIILATAWQTAEWINTYGQDKGEKFYLIQHYESWAGPKERVDATWRMPLKKIVIARWLAEKARELGDEAVAYVPNGMDLERFRITQSIQDRNPRRVGMLYHVYDWKGSKDGICALQTVKQHFPNLEAVFFSAYHRGGEVPSWAEFHKNPPPEKMIEIYNSCAIFLGSSWLEGWFLPGAEAMACGCALVSTDCQGIQEYAAHEKNALLSETKNPSGLAQNLLRLIRDQNLRISLAESGHRSIQKFTWEEATDRFERAILTRDKDIPVTADG